MSGDIVLPDSLYDRQCSTKKEAGDEEKTDVPETLLPQRCRLRNSFEF